MWRLSVSDADADAWPEIQSVNQFNEAPVDGMSFVSTILTMTTEPDTAPEGADPGASLRIAYVTANGRSYDALMCGAGELPTPGSIYQVGTMYPDSTADAYLCAVVPTPDVSGGAWRVGYIQNSDEVFFVGAD